MDKFEIPNVFWKYYDLYRRKLLSIEEFQRLSGLDYEMIIHILGEIQNEKHDDFLRSVCYNKQE